MGLDVAITEHPQHVAFALDGELDIYTVAGFRQELERFDTRHNRLIIDLAKVSLLDSSGLGALVSLLNQSRDSDGQLGLVCPERRLRRVFEISGLRRAFVFGDTEDDVTAALDAERAEQAAP
jgi:anti-sigma B factor antagonist